MPTGNRNIAQHTPKHVKSSSRIPMRHAGQPPTTIISVGIAIVEWLMDPYVTGGIDWIGFVITTSCGCCGCGWCDCVGYGA